MSEQSSKISNEQILALKDGKQDVLKVIFMQLQPRVYRFLWLKTKSIEMAEDLVQETFLRLWEARKRLKPNNNLETYIFRIASNLATDQLRKIERQKEIQSPAKETELSSSNSEDEIEYNQLAKVIDKILSTMPTGPSTAFILSRHEGLSHKEIADVMDISIKTVEKHISKALQVLKQKLEEIDIVGL